ncbi:MAG: DUF1127 domain-containing protein [Paracoccaceae bacterium]
MTYVTSANTIEIDLADRIASAFQGLFADYAKSRLVARTARELNALSTRDLADLGISRNNIKTVAYEAVYNA